MASQSYGLTHRIFVYGTLKSEQPNNHYLKENKKGRAQFVAAAYTDEPYPLVIGTTWNLPFLLHVPGKGHRVYGEIYDIDDACLKWMDEFEEHPTLYERLKVKVNILHSKQADEDCKKYSGESSECWIYFLREYDTRLLELEMLSCYSSDGGHNRIYIAKDDRSSSDNIADALKEECDKLQKLI